MHENIKKKFSDYFDAYTKEMTRNVGKIDCADSFGGWREHNDWSRGWGRAEELDGININKFLNPTSKQNIKSINSVDIEHLAYDICNLIKVKYAIDCQMTFSTDPSIVKLKGKINYPLNHHVDFTLKLCKKD